MVKKDILNNFDALVCDQSNSQSKLDHNTFRANKLKSNAFVLAENH
ncbi:hypothetical protein A33Q_0030 [Indibacter alkaliphilus LW1]|uniref:Uncharacterized protein n=1 Tax=Indibacter alkaliphilus (strain CCUG 57479 / KCTC 22604 / LW1) TaxID=1189612 RepID=S2E7H2_INDAL|nr:hypothetical protein A33Q_0030 [Indibacter alkaliphilus LW1]